MAKGGSGSVKRSPSTIKAGVLLAALVMACVVQAAPNSTVVLMPPGMQSYSSPYYNVYSDIEIPRVKEAILRMTRMAEEYHERTKEFSGQIRSRFSFYLFKNKEDYFRAGGLPGSAGVYMRSAGEPRLMGVAGESENAFTWHLIQHEGFHQFADAVIGGGLPTWLNEGLAEYFGEGIFTGDGFLTGVVPPWRLARLKREIDRGTLLSIPQITLLSPQQWNDRISIPDYDQAWSMVQFLVHGDGGKYQEPLAACIRAIAHGKTFEQAWLETLGPADGFEPRWRAYWQAQPPEPTSELYDRAIVSILTSFLARATAQRQLFTSFEMFAAAGRQDQLKVDPNDWLPRSLLVDALDAGAAMGRWEVVAVKNKQPALRLVTRELGTFTGTFEIAAGRVRRVAVDRSQ